MNAKPTLKWLAAIAFCAIAFPAAADEDWILRQMARTDGNVLGEHYKPIPGETAAAAPGEADLAFLVELQRTDGYVEPVALIREGRDTAQAASR